MAAVTRHKSGSDQLEDLLRRLLTAVMEKLLQRLVGETQSHPPPVVSPPEPTELEQMLQSFLAGQQQRQRPPTRQLPVRRDVVCFSCGKSGHAATRCPNLDESVPTVPPRRMTIDDVSNTPELSGGGGGSVGPLQSFGGVGRGDHGWGHSRTGVST